MSRHYANYFIFNISLNLLILYISVVLQTGIQHRKHQVNYLTLLNDTGLTCSNFPLQFFFLNKISLPSVI